MAKKPKKAIIRTYQVGFGDCFLLTFQYSKTDEKHILIDFGTTEKADSSPKDQMIRVANDIKLRCEGKLDIVVATHRHEDHIGGFTTSDDGLGSGDIIRSCSPKMVIQPWTEDPDLAEDALLNLPTENLQLKRARSLLNMNRVANDILKETEHFLDDGKFASTMPRAKANVLKFLARDNGFFAVADKQKKTKAKKPKKLSNIPAIENLNTMTQNHHYVNYGYKKLGLAKMLPGVNVRVLGPPTIDQYPKVKGQKSEDQDEFWMLHAATSEAASSFIDEQETLFPGARIYDEDYVPKHARWFVRNLREIRGELLLQIARSMDHAMNNTSVILMFDAGKEKLLFPGDAQIENWEFALKIAKDKDKNLALLKGTTFYKVGHHGSRNATPRTLWETFANRHDKGGKGLRSINSTKPGKHGESVETAVPRETLVRALCDGGDYYTTQKLGGEGVSAFVEKETDFIRSEPGLWGEIEIDL